MPAAKKIAKFIAAMLFTSFLSLFVISLSVYDLTSYDTLKSLSKDVLAEQAAQIMPFIEESCKTSSRIEFDIQNDKISFNCSEIRTSDSFAGKILDSIYYKNYSCTVLDCIKTPSAFVSAFGNKLMLDVIFILGILSLICGIVLFFLLDKKITGLGISLIFVGINYFVILLGKNVIQSRADVINSLLDPVAANFLYILIAGIVLAAVGYCKGRNRPEKPRSGKIHKGRRT